MKKIISYLFVISIGCAKTTPPPQLVDVNICFSDAQANKAVACANKYCNISEHCSRLSCVENCLNAVLKSVPGCEKYIPKAPLECH